MKLWSKLRYKCHIFQDLIDDQKCHVTCPHWEELLLLLCLNWLLTCIMQCDLISFFLFVCLYVWFFLEPSIITMYCWLSQPLLKVQYVRFTCVCARTKFVLKAVLLWELVIFGCKLTPLIIEQLPLLPTLQITSSRTRKVVCFKNKVLIFQEKVRLLHVHSVCILRKKD